MSTKLVIDQSTAREVAIINVNIDSDQVIIRESRNPENEGQIRLAMSYEEALQLAKAIFALSEDAYIESIAPDPDWKFMGGNVGF